MSSPPPPEDLAALLTRVRGGDEAALTQLLQQYEPRLRTTARVLLGPLLRPHMDSLDLVQSVHRVLLPGLRDGKFDVSCPEQLIGLALTVIRRKVARNWRRFQREQNFADGPGRGGATAEACIPSRSAQDDPANAAQVNDTLQHLLDGLNEEERCLIELRLEGYSTVEIAERLHCDAHALRARLSRLRQRLRNNGYTEWL
jgi:RNA polymerase sigma-70 factor (ECF subfamily)